MAKQARRSKVRHRRRAKDVRTSEMPADYDPHESRQNAQAIAENEEAAVPSLILPRSESERQQLNRPARKRMLRRPYRGSFVAAQVWDNLDPIQQHVCVARACAQANPDWVFCSTTAAAIWGLCPPYAKLDQIHVAVSPGSHRKNTDLVVFHRLDKIEPVQKDGLRVTSCERTAIDCMRTLPFSEGMAIADAATRIGGWDNLHLARYLDDDLGVKLHGLSRARMVSLLADGLSESGGESIARANMIRCGFVLPLLQLEVASPIDNHRFRIDFTWLPQGSDQAGEASALWLPLSGRPSSGQLLSAAISELGETPVDPRARETAYPHTSEESYRRTRRTPSPPSCKYTTHPSAMTPSCVPTSTTLPISSESNGANLENLTNPIFGELDGKAKYLDERMAPLGPIDALLAERQRESELTLANGTIVRFSYAEAKSPAELSHKLDAFGVPHACEPLVFTKEGRHNEREVRRYLLANVDDNASVIARLEYLDRRHASF